MTRPRLPLVLGAGVLLLAMSAMVLTLYTQPIIDPDHDGPVERLLRRALGDKPEIPPAWTGRTGIELGSAPSPIEHSATTTESPALEWARAAVRADSGAVRGWLSPAVLEVGGIAGDTVRVTLFRLTRRKGCPLLSRLDAVLTGDLSDLRVDRVETSCPRVPSSPVRGDGSV